MGKTKASTPPYSLNAPDPSPPEGAAEAHLCGGGRGLGEGLGGGEGAGGGTRRVLRQVGGENER